MKKITKLFLVLGLLLMVTAILPTILFSEDQPATPTEVVTKTEIEKDLIQLMQAITFIPEQRKFKYDEIFNRLIKKYKGDALLAIKTIHLKYLFLKGNKNEFMKTLKSFPDSYIFKTYLDVDGRQIEFEDSLRSKKEFTKNDLVKLWDKIAEIDREIDKKLQNKDYGYFLDSIKLDEFLGPYSIFEENDEFIWAKGIQVFGGDEAMYLGYHTVEHEFLLNKFKKVNKFIENNYLTIMNDENLFFKLLSLPDSKIMNYSKIFKPFKKNIYSSIELKEIKEALKGLQKEAFGLEKIYSLTGEYPDEHFEETSFQYQGEDPGSNNTVFAGPYYNVFKQKNIEDIGQDIQLLALNKNMFALDVTGEYINSQRLLIFIKNKNGNYIPRIFYKRFPLVN